MKNTVWPDIVLIQGLGASTLRQQIERQIRSSIYDGTLAPGARLPSSRLLAALLAVSRGTVVDAYEALLEAGLILAERGSGVRVARVSPRIPKLFKLEKSSCCCTLSSPRLPV